MKILLMCNAGMSTGILQMKLEEEARKHQVEVNVEAIPMGELNENIDSADIILLGPQIRFAYPDVVKQAQGKPVLLIDVQDFGMMRADKIFQNVLEACKEA